MTVHNLLGRVPAAHAHEVFETLLRREGVRLERIVSHGQASPQGHWYDQAEGEWLLLLAGSAGLRIEGEPEIVVLRPGDTLNLPARRRHRVEWTAAREPTVWLALHYCDSAANEAAERQGASV